ncbi:MAG: glycosyltransferase family 39 protein [Rhodospirillales bacterium]|nr:glycosyltransferase family 39 protein [Rhodospirillales bacterium]
MNVRLVAIAFCCAFAVLCLATIRPAESWGGGDFALYMMHAGNILAGRDYAATPFVFNPANAMMSPRAYPAGYPLVLTPVIALFGPNVRAAAGVTALLMAGSLYLLFRLARPSLGGRWALLLLLAAGLSPVLMNHRDAVESDVAFMFWCYLGLLCLREARPVPLAVAVAMAPLTRTIGFVLPIALALALVWQAWRARGRLDAGKAARRRSAVAVLAGTAAALAVGAVLRADSATYLSYFDRISPGGLPALLARGALSYLSAVVELFGLSFGRLANAPVLALLLAGIAWGFVLNVRRGDSAVELFVVLYLGLLLAYPVHSEPTRYALPVLPLLLVYGLGAARAALAGSRLERAGPAVMVVVFAAMYAPFYATHALFAPLSHRLDGPASQELLAAVARIVPADAVVMTQNPRAVALLTGRRAVSWPELPTAASFWDSAARYQARYLLLDTAAPPAIRERVGLIVADSATRLSPAFANAEFRLLRIEPAVARQ